MSKNSRRCTLGADLHITSETVANDKTNPSRLLARDTDGGQASDGRESMEIPQEKLSLKREIGLIGGISFIVGGIIGSGIFISPKGILRGSGSVGLSFIVWLLCGVISTVGGLCYVELGTSLPSSGGAYTYIKAGLGCFPAFLYVWVRYMISNPGSLVVMAMTSANYATAPFFDDCGPPALVVKLAAMFLMLTVTLVNSYSVKFGTRLNVFLTVAKLVGLGIIICGGMVYLARGNTKVLAEGFRGTTGSMSSIAAAFYSGLFAFSGWTVLNNCVEELKDPYRTLPRAIVISMALVTIVYMLVNVAYLAVLTTAELLIADAVAIVWADRVLGPASVVISIAVVCSTFGTLNGSLFSSVRLAFVAGRKEHAPQVLSYVQVKQFTPFPSVVLTQILSTLIIIPADLYQLINIMGFLDWVFYGLTAISLLLLRYRRPDMHRPIKLPLLLPIFLLVASVFLVIAPLVQDPSIEYLYASAYVAFGAIIYIIFIHFKLRLPCMDGITKFLQLLMEVSPSYFDDIE